MNWWDILILLIWIGALVVNRNYLKPLTNGLAHWPLSSSMILMPITLTVVYLMAWLTYQLNIIPYLLFLGSTYLGLDLYDYVRRIDHFDLKAYMHRASKSIFNLLLTFLLGLVLLRLFLLVGLV